MLRCLRYLWMFQGNNPRKNLPIDFNRSEINHIVVLVWNFWSSFRVLWSIIIEKNHKNWQNIFVNATQNKDVNYWFQKVVLILFALSLFSYHEMLLLVRKLLCNLSTCIHRMNCDCETSTLSQFHWRMQDLVKGRPTKIFQDFANMAKWSHVSETSQYWPGSLAFLAVFKSLLNTFYSCWLCEVWSHAVLQPFNTRQSTGNSQYS